MMPDLNWSLNIIDEFADYGFFGIGELQRLESTRGVCKGLSSIDYTEKLKRNWIALTVTDIVILTENR